MKQLFDELGRFVNIPLTVVPLAAAILVYIVTLNVKVNANYEANMRQDKQIDRYNEMIIRMDERIRFLYENEVEKNTGKDTTIVDN